ncbi:non-ribosomal peptide synthetase [Actinoplanes couchii]|uniref:Carrier domain-containing protein n=1 Tax=Actinoplanes couchii TaxID=403638 RepID=A0ABQ3XTC3_9ACTN|nr:non-ribosomal peptide synthetase [Actinoplanes couchii]MDR6324150.1 amino acid adenylation domain-containing protein [Actinoplanes couchii]GID61768.1 hypothetical protein Aco03nite_101720 [Actinoplanes couchii]
MSAGTVLGRIGDQVRARPAAIAARCGADHLSYADLNARAVGLARRLRAAGVRPGQSVGLRLPRGFDLLTGMIGIGLAGAAFVPLSPDEPLARLTTLLADAGITTVVGSPDEIVLDGVTVIPPGSGATEPDGEDPPGATAGDVAYVIHTSGSTGRPQGVPVAHGSLLRYLDWCARTLLDPAAALPAISSPAFDASLKQLLGPLIIGGTVWLVGDKEAGDPRRITELLREAGPSMLNCVPSMWRAVLDEIEAAGPRPAGLRRLLLGGEPAGAELIARTRAVLPDLEIWNLYGPTEATANATAARLDRGDEEHLGSPIAGSEIHLLAPDGTPVGDGDVGEVFIGGSQLALGYHGNPARTAARFLPDPFTAVPGGRMFRTGDLARRRDGRLEFQGRTDRQVKRSGVQLELGEVENALLRLDEVDRAAVVVVNRGTADVRLLAAVTPAPHRDPAPGGIRSALAAFLPRAALPDQVVVLPTLPLTVGGKVDAAALRALATPSGDTVTEPGDDPADPVETVLIGVWHQVLGDEKVGTRTDFFEAGGHSLAMLRIVGRMAELLDVELPVDVFYDAPTVAEHAGLIRDEHGGAVTSRARRILDQGHDPATWRAAE